VTNPSSISRRVWLAFGGSVLLFGAVEWAAHRARPVQSVGAADNAALTNERELLQGCDDRVRDHLREQQQGLARLAWTPATLAALQQRLGAGWRWTWEPGDRPSRGTLQRVTPRIEEWPAYETLIAELAGQPGVIIESVEILADGTARDRAVHGGFHWPPFYRRGRTVSRRTAGRPEPRPADRRPGGESGHDPEGRNLHFAPPPVRLRRASGFRDGRHFVPAPTLRVSGPAQI